MTLARSQRFPLLCPSVIFLSRAGREKCVANEALIPLFTPRAAQRLLSASECTANTLAHPSLCRPMHNAYARVWGRIKLLLHFDSFIDTKFRKNRCSQTWIHAAELTWPVSCIVCLRCPKTHTMIIKGHRPPTQRVCQSYESSQSALCDVTRRQWRLDQMWVLRTLTRRHRVFTPIMEAFFFF